MNELLSMMARHGYALTFAILFAEAVGVPLPAAIGLVAAGAGVASHTLSASSIFLVAIVALLLGDTVQFWMGRYMGWSLLGFLCRVSINPETCILRSAESFYKRGKTTLVISKFIPGVNTMAAPLAGSMNMQYWQFLQLDLAGSALYAVTYLLVVMEAVIIAAFAVYAVYRIVQFSKNWKYRVVPRVQVQELAARLAADEGKQIRIVDVRSHGYYDKGAERIQGSIRIEPNNLDEEIKHLPKDADIYLYCT
jgi:membrane protein DedA with SNARE-associated domain